MRTKYLNICILIGTCLLLTQCDPDRSQQLFFGKLSCETLENPLGIDNPEPKFSWILSSSGYDQSQSAYQILVASSTGSLSPEKADMWNSGKVTASQSVHVPYHGASLLSTRKYWWKVKIWDQDGKESNWSALQHFEMGLLHKEDWEDAQWISLSGDTRSSAYRFREYQTNRMDEPEIRTSHPAGYFRKEIRIRGSVTTARAYICGLGYYELYLNGNKVGDHVLDPMPTSYNHHALYVTYDISSFLKAEDNTLGVILGNGFYGQNIAFWRELEYGKPAFKIMVHLVYEDGSSEEFVSNESWKASTGAIVFDNVYAGETYDARYEQPGWDRNGFDDTSWSKASVVSPDVGKLRSQLMPPIREIREIDPVDVFRGANGNWIVNFGQNIAGWVRIIAEQERGDVIKIRTAEALTRTGDAIHPGSLGKDATGVNQLDAYICKGDGREEWQPRFTYQAFQFAEISGLRVKPSGRNVKAVLVHNDMQETGTFKSSDPLLNRMVEVSKWTVLDNLHGFPEDCPAREKCGWLGDAHATAQFNLYSYDMNLLYRKYSEDIESQLIPRPGEYSDQDKTFLVPTQVAPGKRTGGSASLDWGIAEIYVPWYVYLNTGDLAALERHYADMKDLVGYYLSFRNEQGVIENGLGDWCPPLWDRRDNPGAMECHPYVSANAYFFDILEIMSRVADLMGEAEYADELQGEREILRNAFNVEFLEEIGDREAKWYGSQTATVMALQFGMVPNKIKDEVIEGLIFDIVEVKHGHHSTGIHGNRYLYSLLNEIGEDELANSVLMHPDFPSQAYILNAGLTTWPERQWEWASGIEWDRSLNHPMQAGFAAFFYESLAGIKPMPDFPGFKRFLVKPTIWKQLDYAGAELESPFGRIRSKWSHTESGAMLELNVPFNTETRVILPIRDGTTLEIHHDDGKVIPYEYVTRESGILLGSGAYTILFETEENH